MFAYTLTLGVSASSITTRLGLDGLFSGAVEEIRRLPEEIRRLGNPVSQVNGPCGYNGVHGAPTYDCAAGLECIPPGRFGAYGICGQPNALGLGRGGDLPAPSDVGGPCGYDGTQHGLEYTCKIGLDCVKKEHWIGLGTCEQPVLGATRDPIISGEGEKCGWNAAMPSPVYKCEDGLVCDRPDLSKAYGTCRKPTLGNALVNTPIVSYHEGEKCGFNGVLHNPQYVCDTHSGLVCQEPGRVGAYGVCVQTSSLGLSSPLGGGVPCFQVPPCILGSSGEIVTKLISWKAGEPCGFNGVHGAPEFVCGDGLTCNEPSRRGAYGTCVTASLGSSGQTPAKEGEACACKTCGPNPWTRPCEAGLDCVGNSFEASTPSFDDDGYKTCQKPRLGASGSEGCWSNSDCASGKTCFNTLLQGVVQKGFCI